jgi:pyruvyltransferase
VGKLIPVRRAVNNFGDLLGPVLVRRMLDRLGITEDGAGPERRLVAVGSILHFAQQGDTVWGSGVNGKSFDMAYDFEDLDVRAVRGPLTAEFLRKRGIAVPEVFGDPGLLVGTLWDAQQLRGDGPLHPVTVIPNLNDYPRYQKDENTVDPRQPLETILRRIARSELVVGSSLHGVVIAESLGVPARLVRSGSEPMFKYEDYYYGSGRASFSPADTVEAAIRAGGESPLDWGAQPLLDAFPSDLWK